MQLQEIQSQLKNVFDSVSETNDDTLMARINKADYLTRNDAIGDVQRRLHSVFPEATIHSHGSVGRPVVQWYIEFSL